MRHEKPTLLIEPLEPRRLFATGGLDASFGDGGKVATDIRLEPNDDVLIAAQPDGAIMAAGVNRLARFTAAGQLDQKFGLAGVVADPALDRPHAIALQGDGKTLVLAGMFADEPGEGGFFFITRYHTNGKIDKSFGHRGRVAVDNVGQLTEQQDGKILFASAGTLRRFLTDGSPDLAFGGGDGAADNPAAFTGYRYGLTADGRIVMAGTTRTTRFGVGPDGDPMGVQYFTDDTTIVRFNGDGTLDTTFANQGKRYFDSEDDNAPYPEFHSQLVVAPDGAIAGSTPGAARYFRLTPAGEMDTNFDGDGIVELTDTEPFFAYGSAIALQSDGKLVVAGTHSKNDRDFRPADFDQMVRRLNPDGSVDTTFAGGKSITDFGRALDSAQRVLLAPDGTILVAGRTSDTGTSPRLTLARLWRDDGPAAQAIARAVISEQTTPYRFRINWRDDQAVDLSSIDNGDIKAIGPDGSVRKAYVVGADATGDSPNFVMNFKVAAPGGQWDAADNGMWTLRVLSNHVSDTDANRMRGRTLVTFTVNIPAAPATAVSAQRTMPPISVWRDDRSAVEERDDDLIA